MNIELLKGLTDAEVNHSRDCHGSNVLTPPKRDPWYILFLEKFKDPLIQILSVAAIIALVLGVIKSEYLEPIGIIFFIFLVTLLYTKAVSLTEFFTIFVLLQWWNLFNVRVFGQRRSIFDGLLKNPAFAGIALVILVGQFLIVQYGGAMFRTEPLSMETWGLILAGTSIVTVVRELFYQISKIFK